MVRGSGGSAATGATLHGILSGGGAFVAFVWFRLFDGHLCIISPWWPGAVGRLLGVALD